MITTYKLLDKMFAYTMSGEPMPVFGIGTERDIPNFLHVPTFVSVSHMDVSMLVLAGLGNCFCSTAGCGFLNVINSSFSLSRCIYGLAYFL